MKLSMEIDPVNDSIEPPTSGRFEHLTVLSTNSGRVVWTAGGDIAAKVGWQHCGQETLREAR